MSADVKVTVKVVLIVSGDDPQELVLFSVIFEVVLMLPPAAVNLFVSAVVAVDSYCAQPFLVVELSSSIISPEDGATIAVVTDAVWGKIHLLISVLKFAM